MNNFAAFVSCCVLVIEAANLDSEELSELEANVYAEMDSYDESVLKCEGLSTILKGNLVRHAFF